MTNQQIFDKVYLGLKSQDFQRSVSAGHFCRFRGDNGRKCAIGWLIPDEEYLPEMESMTNPTRLRYCSNNSLGNALMDAHDSRYEPEEMVLLLCRVAASFALKVPE